MWSVYIFIVWDNVNYLLLKIFILMNLKNDQHGELDNQFDPLNKIVLKVNPFRLRRIAS